MIVSKIRQRSYGNSYSFVINNENQFESKINKIK